MAFNRPRPAGVNAATTAPGASGLVWGESSYGPGEMPQAKTVAGPPPATFPAPGASMPAPRVPTGGPRPIDLTAQGNQAPGSVARPLPMPRDRPYEAIWSIGDMIPGAVGDIRQVLAALLGMGRPI